MQVASKALKLFNIEGAIESVAPLGFGHINDSYSVVVGGNAYLLQRLNTNVFREPEIVESNLTNILSFAPELFPLHLKGANGEHHQSDGENLWRVQEFVTDSYSPSELALSELREIAKGYGRYTARFAQEDPKSYQESIPQFHDLRHRLAQFNLALEENAANRRNQAVVETETINKFKWIAEKFDELVAKGLPLKVCHNDAKAGNCLLSKQSGAFLKVVDLDTVGPGYVLFDLGDMLRSMLFNIPENQSALDDLSFNQERFDAIMTSFLNECGESLEPVEIDSLPFGGLYMTYIMAVRFLTDYLNGDVYYKICHPEENLIRTRNQLRILELMSKALV